MRAQLHLDIAPRVRDELHAVAELEGRSMTEVVRILIDDGLHRRRRRLIGRADAHAAHAD